MLTELESSVWRVLLRFASYYGKKYAFPKQETIVRKCEKWFGVQMSRRTVNRVLASLEAKGFFVRVRRHSKKSTGELWLRSTLYKLSSRTFAELGRLGKLVSGFFESFAVPKMAQYFSFQKGRSLSPVDNLGINESSGSKGTARSGPIILQIKTV